MINLNAFKNRKLIESRMPKNNIITIASEIKI